MLILLAAGGGVRGGWGGISVGVTCGVPVPGVNLAVGDDVAVLVGPGAPGVCWVFVGRRVGVAGPGYPGDVGDTTGPG
jgi:hypothetical protein